MEHDIPRQEPNDLVRYSKAQLQGERVVTGFGLPWTILRVTRFYDDVLSDRAARLRPDVLNVLFVNAVEKRPRFFFADNLDLLNVVEEPANL
jgi:hypothetical protein